MADDRTQLMGARALIPGYEILWYEIESVLGQGGFGITYLAKDKNLDRRVAIKEYLPTSFAYRNQDYSVKPITTDHGDNFAWGLNSFLTEAQTLARFSHDNIVRVQSVFEQNNTAYMVMDYEEGANLSFVYKNREQLDQAFFEDVFFPIFDGLQDIHELGFIHRDIKPANIYIRENNTPVLIDFGSARQTSQQQTGEMTSLVSQGYTPLEQYSPNYGEQGPWTDIYALAATLYQGVSGSKPAESLSRSACLLRSQPDIVVPLRSIDFPAFTQTFLNAIHAGLAIQPEERPVDLFAWRSLFDNDQFSTRDVNESENNFSSIDDTTRNMSATRANTNGTDDALASFSGEPSTAFEEDPWPTEMSGRVASKPQADRSNDSRATHSEPIDILELNLDLDEDMHRPATSVHNKGKQPKEKKRSKFLPIAASVLLAIGVALVGYVFSIGYFTSGALNVAELPRPNNPVETTLPEQHVVKRLSELDRLALYYAQAYAIDQNNAEVNIGIQDVYAEVAGLAAHWNTTRFSNIGESIRRVVNRLPNDPDNHKNINALLSDTNKNTNSVAILSLIDNNQIVMPAGNSVIDVISSVNKSEYDLLTQAPAWDEMMKRMANAAAAHLNNADFNSGARIVEAALAIHPEDVTMLKLRDHLALRTVQ